MFWQGLFTNLAAVAMVISVWVHAENWLRGGTRLWRNAVFGLAMGIGAIISMLLAIRVADGIFFDLRGSLVAIAAAFGGPVAMLLAAGIAILFRMALGGGGLTIGIAYTAVAALLGLAVNLTGRRRGISPWHAIALALIMGILTLAVVAALPRTLIADALPRYGLPITLMMFLATGLAGLVILAGKHTARERDLLRAAFAQSPDFQYIKNPKGEFVAVNDQVARHNGFGRPSALVGKTDFDIVSPERARELFALERQVLKTGTPVRDLEERLTDQAGNVLWYTTTKVPLHDRQGHIVGLSGVTRDITRRKRIEEALAVSRNQLSFALAEMADGLAMFDQKGFLVFCNEQYRRAFPRTGEIRRPGANLRDILGAVVATEEQLSIARDNVEEWIERTYALLWEESDEEVELFDGRWLHLRIRPTSDGTSMVVVSDLTRIKQTELALRENTEQLRNLAATDGLTGLPNRRAFDQALDAELRRSARNQTPISLLMIDVDRFKAYNDLYGHSAGDECLRAIARTLRESLDRPGDIAARYGGEEFAVILPDTDSKGALHVAEKFRAAIRQMRMLHEGSDEDIVTASVGVGSYPGVANGRNAGELINRADEALYGAKNGGRDLSNVWAPRDIRLAETQHLAAG